ncbi:MAG: hypothetical protein M3512_07905 [Bacteroidota bacterium]|nr:hypothetical protein [Bacteroidota bacterium]
MIQKFFPLDKNYILKKAQADAQNDLLIWLVQEVIQTYNFRFNPLGIEDDTIIKIKKCSNYNICSLELFYQELSGIYRYKFNEIQLELIFDGRSHYEKYRQEWEENFKEWAMEFCQYTNFLRAVLEGAVIFTEAKRATLAQARMKYFLSKYFELKVYRYKGIRTCKMA